MATLTTNNNRIAKNTALLYGRMLLLMVISLYTSRVVLKVLGVDDFGTYSIVGGVVVAFTFISNAMAAGTQRHLSYELGKVDGNIPLIFSACLKIHIALAIVVGILAETLGLWFLNTKMNFPNGQMDIVNWVYQFSIFTCMLGVIQVPYIAVVIAHEKMSFYSYISIVEAFMKLGLVFLLIVIPLDKLFLYALLMTVSQLLIFLTYIYFCHVKFSTIKIIKILDKGIYKQIVSFSVWVLFGALANVGYQQGVNIIVNIYFGVALNAAVGIANQINSAVHNFAANFQQALNPQLIQAEASHDKSRQYDLIIKSSKFSFFIMYVIAYPLSINLPIVLKQWLGNYPPHTVGICICILAGVLITCISGPLWVTIYATGKVKYYQIIVSIVALSILPIIYFGGNYGFNVEQMFIVRSFNYIFVMLVQLYFLKKYIDFSILYFLRNVILPIFGSVSLSIISFIIIKEYIPQALCLKELFFQSFMYFITVSVLIFFFGLSNKERIGLVKLCRQQFKNKLNEDSK